MNHVVAELARVRPVHSAVEAYRADRQGRDAADTFSDHDGLWLTVAGLLTCNPASLEAPVVRTAREMAAVYLSPSEIARGGRQDPPRGDAISPLNGLRVLAEDMEDCGALRLAATVLDALQSLGDVAVQDRGRLLIQRARVAWKSGDVEHAEHGYARAEAVAAAYDDRELQARVLLGRCALAQRRGNYPVTERLARACLRIAESEGFVALAAAARVGLVSCAAHKGNFDRALTLAWTNYENAGADSLLLAESIANLGHVLLEVGELRAARSAFARAVTLTTAPRILLPALGGLAMTSARMRDAATVEWTILQLRSGAARYGSSYEFAHACLDAARALRAIGRSGDAQVFRETAVHTAKQHGYHEVAYIADELLVAAESPVKLRRDAATVVRRVDHFPPTELPESLEAISGAT